MAGPIDFYFDFGSPYAYFTSLDIDALARRHDRMVAWRPMLLGVALKSEGTQPLSGYPLKGRYSRHDWDRTARRRGVPFRLPPDFPANTIVAQRAFYWLHDHDAEGARNFARAVFRDAFGEGRSVSEVDTVAAIAGAVTGIPPAEVAAAVQEPAVKDRLRAETDAALAAGVFGSPFILVDGEPFWGNDRLGEVDSWLSTGGW
jgi:2-hydroxychromene-2-carboxylate isomerase